MAVSLVSPGPLRERSSVSGGRGLVIAALIGFGLTSASSAKADAPAPKARLNEHGCHAASLDGTRVYCVVHYFAGSAAPYVRASIYTLSPPAKPGPIRASEAVLYDDVEAWEPEEEWVAAGQRIEAELRRLSLDVVVLPVPTSPGLPSTTADGQTELVQSDKPRGRVSLTVRRRSGGVSSALEARPKVGELSVEGAFWIRGMDAFAVVLVDSVLPEKEEDEHDPMESRIVFVGGPFAKEGSDPK